MELREGEIAVGRAHRQQLPGPAERGLVGDLPPSPPLFPPVWHLSDGAYFALSDRCSPGFNSRQFEDLLLDVRSQ